MSTLTLPLIYALRGLCASRATLALENLTLRQQLTIYQRNQKHPRLHAGERFSIRRISGDHPEWG